MNLHPYRLLPLVLALLAACQNTVISRPSSVALPAAFDHAQSARNSADIAQWWRQWRDPVLDALIERGLQQNYDIAIARSRLEEARAVARLAQADLGPKVGTSATFMRMDARIDNPLDDRARDALGRYPQAAVLNRDHFTLEGSSLSGVLNAAWEPDIFGQKRSDADAARYAALGAQEQAYGAQLLVAGDIATHYLQARAAQSRQRAAERSIAVLKRLTDYVQSRFQAGHLSAYEVEQARAQLSAAQARESTLTAEYAAHVRAIAVLTGHVPQAFRLAESHSDLLDKLPEAPGGHTPQGMVERRPDIRAAAAQVQAYAARLASARADLLPRFSINFLGQGMIGIDGERSLSGWSSLLSVGLQVPLLTNGRIQANIDAADARLKTALLQYDRTLLQALAEVDTAYHNQNALVRQNALLAQAHRQTDKQAADAEKLFRYGGKTLDNVLTARLHEIQAQENLIAAQLARAQTLVGLYKALGGGWQGVVHE